MSPEVAVGRIHEFALSSISQKDCNVLELNHIVKAAGDHNCQATDTV